MMKLSNMLRGREGNDAPARQLLSLWTHDEGTLDFWRASSNFVYTFSRDGNRHFLRFIHEEDNSIRNMEAELDFVRYLIDCGYPAAAPVRSDKRRWIEEATTEYGKYFGVVFEQAQGTYIPLKQMTNVHLEHWGQSLASLHLLSESYSSGSAARQTWSDALQFASSILRSDSRNKTLLVELDRLHEQLAELPSAPGSIGLIHFDFETDNIFFDDEKMRYTAFDFDDCMIHWFIMDIVSAVSDLYEEQSEDAARMIDRFIAGYKSVKRMDDFALAQLDAFRRFKDFYKFARIKRSMEDFGAAGAPEWAVQLQMKLERECERIRDLYRPEISLRPVDQHNWYACTQLEVSDEQKHVFPVPAVYWLAESAYCGFTPNAVYAGEQLVGLTVHAVDPDDSSHWIMAFMIDRNYQNRGLGRAGMEKLISHLADSSGCDKIMLGHRPDNKIAYHLYDSLGFQKMDRNAHEIIRELNMHR